MHTVGDILVLSDFTQGGSISTVKVYMWVGAGGSDGSLDLIGSGFDCFTASPSDLVCATVNPNDTLAPWPYVPKFGEVNVIPRGSLFEGGMDLTSLLQTRGLQVSCLSSFLAETRSSQSVTSQLKDFALGAFELCAARIRINPPDAINDVGTNHLLTVTVEKRDPSTGFAFAGASNVLVTASVTDGGDAVTVFVGSSSCTTGGSGTCTLTVKSSMAGSSTVTATANVPVGSEIRTVTTDGTAGNSGPAIKRWVNAKISISPSATNGIGESHTFIVHVEKDDGTGFIAAFGVVPTISFVGPTPGTVHTTDSVGDTPGCSSGTDANGNCVVVINSNTAGIFTAHASADIVVGGLTIHRETNGQGGNTGDAAKTYVAGTLRWTKLDSFGKPLGGANFQFCRTANYVSQSNSFLVLATPVCSNVLDNNTPDIDPVAGAFQVTGLVLGRYVVQETSAPAGYAADTKVVSVELTLTTSIITIDSAFVNIPIATGKITPTGTTCQDYVSGSAQDLNEVFYGVKGAKINNAAPGVFFYYTKITAPSSSFTIDILQTNSNPSVPLFNVQQDKTKPQIILYNADCTTSNLGTVSSPQKGQARIMVNGAGSGQIFIVSIKYSTSSVVGTNVPTPTTVHYDFKTKANGIVVDQDLNGLDLKRK